MSPAPGLVLSNPSVAAAATFDPLGIYGDLFGANGDPGSTTGSVIMVSGTIYASRIRARKSGSCTGVTVGMATGGSGFTAGQSLAGIYAADGQTQLGITSDLQTQLGATGVNRDLPWNAAVNLTSGIDYWVLLMAVASAMPTLQRFSNAVFNNVKLSGATVRWGVQATSQTALPATFTPSALTASTIALAEVLY